MTGLWVSIALLSQTQPQGVALGLFAGAVLIACLWTFSTVAEAIERFTTERKRKADFAAHMARINDPQSGWSKGLK